MTIHLEEILRENHEYIFKMFFLPPAIFQVYYYHLYIYYPRRHTGYLLL